AFRISPQRAQRTQRRNVKSHSSVLNGRAEFFAVGEYDFAEINVRTVAFDAMADQSDLLAHLNGIPTPALPGQRVRTVGFANPLFNLARLVRDVEMDERVGIDPLEFRYDALQGDSVRHVVI